MWMSHGDRVESAAARLPARSARRRTRPSPPSPTRSGASTACSSIPRSRTRRAAASSWRTSCFASAGCRRRWTMAQLRRRGGGAASAQQVGERGPRHLRPVGRRRLVGRGQLLLNAIGDRLTCIFVDNGLLRQGERAGVEALFAGAFKADLHVVDAEARFLTALAGVTDPEQKRKIIGREFIAVFEEEAKRIDGVEFLGAGHALSRRHRERVGHSGPSRDDQEPPQRRRPARAHEAQARRAAARALQGRSARARRRARPAARTCCGASRSPGPGLAVRMLGEVTKRALRRAARGRRHHRRGDPRRRPVRVDLAVLRRAPCR